MALAPEEALQVSPKAQLSPADLAEVEQAEASIDRFLSTQWGGTVATLNFPPSRERLLAEILRRYELAGWSARVAPSKGSIVGGDGAQASAGFEVTLIPKWERFVRVEVPPVVASPVIAEIPRPAHLAIVGDPS